MHHKLKIEDCFAKRILAQEKNFEIRFNDRDYQVGDLISFTHTLLKDNKYRVVYIHTGLGLKEGYVIMQLVKTTKNK